MNSGAVIKGEKSMMVDIILELILFQFLVVVRRSLGDVSVELHLDDLCRIRPSPIFRPSPVQGSDCENQISA